MDDEAAGRFAAAIDTLGTEWHLPQAAFKFYPCCHYIHPFIEALDVALRERPGGAIDTILCEVPPGAAALISEPWERKLRPQTGHDARYSLPIALAARLVEGAVTPATFANAPNAAIVAKAECISARAMKNADFPQRFEARLHVRFTDGSTTEVYVDDVFGGARRPPTREAVREKFRANAALIGSAGDVRALEDGVLSIERTPLGKVSQTLRRFRKGAAAHAAA
jgi:2-methylcitrate dehydratase PrpD